MCDSKFSAAIASGYAFDGPRSRRASPAGNPKGKEAAHDGTDRGAKPGRSRRATPAEPTVAEQVGKALNSPLARTVAGGLVRGLFGVLGVPATARRRRRRLF